MNSGAITSFTAFAARGPQFLESGRSPAFLLEIERQMSAIQADIEARLAEREPEVEVLLAEVMGGKVV